MKNRPQEIGLEFETLFSKRYSVSKQPRSGGGPFYKMDAQGRRILYSLKATTNKSFRVEEKDLKEVDEAVKGMGGLGGDYIPALSFTLVKGDKPVQTDPTYIVLEMDDFVRLLQEEAKLFTPDKNEIKKQRAKVPELMRQEKE